MFRFDHLEQKFRGRIDVARNVTLPSADVTYQLRGGIMHKGRSIRSGHYVTIIICPSKGNIVFDDETVSC